MKKLWKTPEKPVIFPLKNSQDFNGFQFHSVMMYQGQGKVHKTSYSVTNFVPLEIKTIRK